MQEVSQSRTLPRLGVLQLVILLLIAATAFIHLYLGIMRGAPDISKTVPFFFYLNFLGYLALGIALYLPALARYQSIVRWVLMGYTAITIIAWFMITNARPNTLAYIDKPIELALIILLFIEDRQARQLK